MSHSISEELYEERRQFNSFDRSRSTKSNNQTSSNFSTNRENKSIDNSYSKQNTIISSSSDKNKSDSESLLVEIKNTVNNLENLIPDEYKVQNIITNGNEYYGIINYKNINPLCIKKLRDKLNSLDSLSDITEKKIDLTNLTAFQSVNVVFKHKNIITQHLSNLTMLFEKYLNLENDNLTCLYSELNKILTFIIIEPKIFLLYAMISYEKKKLTASLNHVCHLIALDGLQLTGEESGKIYSTLITSINTIPDIYLDIAQETQKYTQIEYYQKYNLFKENTGDIFNRIKQNVAVLSEYKYKRSQLWMNSGSIYGDRTDTEINELNLYKLSVKPPYNVIASKSIPPGTDIEWDIPIAIVPISIGAAITNKQDDISNWCLHCCAGKHFVKTLTETIACPIMPHTCPFRFCATNCYMRNSAQHEHECSFLHTQMLPLVHETGFTASFILLIIRLLLKTHNFRKNNLAKHNFTKTSLPKNDPLIKLCKLKSYATEINRLRPELWKAICCLSRAIAHFFPIIKLLGLSTTDLDEIICRVHTYSIQVTSYNEYMPRSGLPETITILLLSDILSEFNHSCTPNAFIRYDTNTNRLIIRSIKLIELNSPITISYIADLLAPTHLRKNLFASTIILKCNCIRCSDPTEGLRYTGAYRCRNCIVGYTSRKSSAYVNIIMQSEKSIYNSTLTLAQLQQKNSQTTVWECNSCGSYIDESIDSQDVDINTAIIKVDQLINTDSHINPVKIRYYYQYLLQRLKIFCHPNNYLLQYVLVKLIGTYKVDPEKDFEKAGKLQKIAYCNVSLILDTLHPIYIYHALSLAQIMLKLNPNPIYLCRALWTSYLCYGSSHIIYKIIINELRYISMITKIPYTRSLYNDGKVFRIQKNHYTQNASIATVQPSQTKSQEEYHIHKLFTYIRQGNLKEIEKYFANCTEVELYYLFCVIDCYSGFNILGVAAYNKKEEIFYFFCKNSPIESLLYRSEFEMTILILICASRQYADMDVYELIENDNINARCIEYLLEALQQRFENEDQNNINELEQTFKSFTNINLYGSTTKQLVISYINEQTHILLGAQKAIHYAASRGKSNCVKVLVNNGADVNSLNSELATPLHLAAIENKTRTVELLINLGSKIDHPNYRGETPLMLACYSLSVNCVKTLIEAGANVMTATLTTGITCLHAVSAGLTNTFKLYFGKQIDKTRELNIQIVGSSEHTLHKHYETDIYYSHANIPSVPWIDTQSLDILRYPEEFSRRISNAEAIIMNIRQHIRNNIVVENKEDIFMHTSTEGFTATELLLHQWNKLQEIRDNMISDTKWNALNFQNTENFILAYLNDVSTRIYSLANFLKPQTRNEPASLSLQTMAVLGERKQLNDNNKITVNELELALARDEYKNELLLKSTKDLLKVEKEKELKELLLLKDEEIKKHEIEEKKVQEETKAKLQPVVWIDGEAVRKKFK